MIYCPRLICLEVAMNILIPFGNYCLGWQQLRKAARALGWLPADRTPACMPAAVAVRLLEHRKFIVICCSNKTNAVCVPRNFWKSQQICRWLLQPVKQIYGLSLGSYAAKKGKLESLMAVTAAHWAGFLGCPMSLWQLGHHTTGSARTHTYLTFLMKLLNLMWATTSVQGGDVRKGTIDFYFK